MIFSPTVADPGPVIVTEVATVSANVVVTFAAVTTVSSASVPVAVIEYAAGPNLIVYAPVAEQWYAR